MAEPAYCWVPEYDATNGDIAAEVGAQLGWPPDDDQRAILDAMYGYHRRTPNRPAAFSVGTVAPRQNIKTSTYIIAALTDLFVFRIALHIWTAHVYKTSRKTFEEMLALIEGNGEFSRLCKRPRIANNQEAIRLKTGEEIQFFARSKGGGRGITAVPRVTLDEALFLEPADIGAVLPSMATIEDAQVRYGSSAGFANSHVLRRVRDRGRAGNDPALAYFEWCAEEKPCGTENCTHDVGVPSCALDDAELLAQANPALGRRITLKTLQNFRGEMPPAEFKREFLGWWDEPHSYRSALSAEAWAACAEDAPPQEWKCIVVDMGWDRSRVSTAVAALRSDGKTQAELVEYCYRSAWSAADLAEKAKQHNATVMLHGAGPAASLAADIEAAGITPTVVSNGDLALACGSFFDTVEARRLVHVNDPILNGAVSGATTKPLGDAWAWSRKSSAVDISPLVAVTLAAWGAAQGTSSGGGWVMAL